MAILWWAAFILELVAEPGGGTPGIPGMCEAPCSPRRAADEDEGGATPKGPGDGDRPTLFKIPFELDGALLLLLLEALLPLEEPFLSPPPRSSDECLSRSLSLPPSLLDLFCCCCCCCSCSCCSLLCLVRRFWNQTLTCKIKLKRFIFISYY